MPHWGVLRPPKKRELVLHLFLTSEFGVSFNFRIFCFSISNSESPMFVKDDGKLPVILRQVTAFHMTAFRDKTLSDF